MEFYIQIQSTVTRPSIVLNESPQKCPTTAHQYIHPISPILPIAPVHQRRERFGLSDVTSQRSSITMEVQTKKGRGQSIADDFFAFCLKVVGPLTRHIRRKLATTIYCFTSTGFFFFFFGRGAASRTGRSAWREREILENAETWTQPWCRSVISL